MEPHDREPVAAQLVAQLLERVLDLVVGVGVGKQSGAVEPPLPGRRPVRHPEEEKARGLQDAPDLGQHEVALVYVLEQVEAQDRVEARVRQREPLLHIARDEAHVRHADVPARAEPHPERREVRVEADDARAASRGLERVHAVAAADVEERRAGRHVLEVPVVRRRVGQQVLRVHVLAALPRPLGEPDREPLGLRVGEDDRREDEAIELLRAHRVSRIAT